MTAIYVDSVAGNNLNSGLTWALAKATIAGATAIEAAGDTIYVSPNHAETTAASQTLTIAGTYAAPVKIVCANPSTEPPVALMTGARLITTAGSSISISALAAYFYGISFECGTGATNPSLAMNGIQGGRMVYDNCSFQVLTTSGSAMSITSTYSSETEWRNCTVKFGHTALVLTQGGTGFFHWNGGGFVAGTATPNPLNYGLFGSNNGSACALIENVDFSNLAAGVNLVNATMSLIVIRNCKLPSGWSGKLLRSIPVADMRAAMYNCSAGAENYRLWVQTPHGEIRDNTIYTRAGGASDGTTTISWRMETFGQVKYPVTALESDNIAFWCGQVGSPITVSLDMLTDAATALTNRDIWIEASYLGTNGSLLGTQITTRPDVVATIGTDWPTSSSAWVVTSMTNPKKQMMSVTFTPQMVGFVKLTVFVAKVGAVIYLDPKVIVPGFASVAQYQTPGSIHGRFASTYLNVMVGTKQEQVPSNNFVIESVSPNSIAQDRSSYFFTA